MEEIIERRSPFLLLPFIKETGAALQKRKPRTSPFTNEEVRVSANQLTRKINSATLPSGKSPLGIRGLAF
jgi:hypothetical protein